VSRTTEDIPEKNKKKNCSSNEKTNGNENNREQISYKYLININLKNLEKLVKVLLIQWFLPRKEE